MNNFNPDYLLQEQGIKWILVDFDGVLHKPTEDFSIKNKPIKGSKQALTKLRKAGFKIIIYTARHWIDYVSIEAWLNYHKIPFDRIICGKVLGLLFIDDRAYRFKGNWNKEIKTILKIAKSEYKNHLKRIKQRVNGL